MRLASCNLRPRVPVINERNGLKFGGSVENKKKEKKNERSTGVRC